MNRRAHLVALAVAGAALTSCGGDEVTAGPLASDVGNGLYFAAVTGKPFVYGVPVAYNRGDEPAVLDRISLRAPSEGLELVETGVSGPERKLLSLAADHRWPSPDIDDVRPVRSFRLAPVSQEDGERGVELLFVMRAQRAGRYTATGAVIDYHVGERRHRVTMRTAMAVCVTAKLDLETACRKPEIPER